MSETKGRYDAIVVGAGHNGLVSAAYLARAGRRVLVLEKGDRIGGATRSEEVLPGFHQSVFSYLVSLLRPEVIDELDLVEHGLFVIPLETTLNPLSGGDEIYREADASRTYWNLRRHSARDAEAYFEFKLMMEHVGRLAHRLLDVVPRREWLQLLDGSADSVAGLGELVDHFAVAPIDQKIALLQMFSMSAADFLGQWFEHDAIIAALSTSSVIGSFVSPRSPGSAYVLLHHYMGEVDGHYRSWGFQPGGTGEVAGVIARSARTFGAEIRTDAEVERILVGDSMASETPRVRGVVLASGEEISCTCVLSSAAPQVSLGELVDADDIGGELASRVGRWDSFGCSAKVNLALDRCPSFACRPEYGVHLAGGISIAPGLDYLEQAFDDARDGRWSRRPFIDIVIPSAVDTGMAPPGHHVMSCFVQYAPYELGGGRSWDDERDRFGDAVVSLLDEFLPGLSDSVLHRQVLVPPDIERVAGIPGGNIFHGELRLDQLLLNRPGLGVDGYRTQLDGYYVCGSGAQQGGGISGGPGRHAALQALREWEPEWETNDG